MQNNRLWGKYRLHPAYGIKLLTGEAMPFGEDNIPVCKDAISATNKSSMDKEFWEMFLICQISSDFLLINCNSGVSTLFGTDTQSLMGKSILDLLFKKNKKESSQFKAWLSGTNESHSCSIKNGITNEVTNVLWSKLQSENDSGFTLFGINTSKKACSQLHLKENRLSLALDSAELGMWDWDMTTDKLIFSEQWAQMLGYKKEELSEDISTWRDMVHPEDLEGISNALLEHIEGDCSQYEGTVRLKAKDGSWKWILSRGKVVERDNNGKALRMCGTHLDITPRIINEFRLKAERLLFTDGPVIVIKWKNIDGWPVEYISDNIIQLGYEASHFISGDVQYSSIIHPFDVKRVFSEVAFFSENNASFFEQEYRIFDHNGETHWIYDFTRIIRNEKEEITHYHGYILDITDRIKLEQELRSSRKELERHVQERTRKLAHQTEKLLESQIHLNAILDNIPDIAWLKDKNGCFIAVNEAFVQAANKPKESILGSTDIELWPAELALAYQRTDNEIMTSKKSQTIEEQIFSGEGPAIWVETAKSPFFNDEGEVTGTTGIARNITQRKQIQEILKRSNEELEKAVLERTSKLKTSEARLKLALETSKQGLWDWNLNTDDVYYDEEWERIMGYEPGQAAPKADTWKQTLHSDDISRVLSSLVEHMKGNKDFFVEYRAKKITGEWIWIHCRGKIIEWDNAGNPSRLIGTIEDISERKKSEEELRLAREKAESADRSKTEFLANMSHEIRTPMTGIIGLSQDILAENGLSPDQKENLNLVLLSAESLLQIINDILDLSKIEAGKLQIKPQWFNIKTLLREIQGALQLQLRQKSLGFNVMIQADVPEQIYGDPLRLKQVLLNLAGNAVKFTDKGEITISIEFRSSFHKQLYFAVKDTGLGIEPDHLERIFNSFEQVDGTSTRKAGGTGLGLTISRRLSHAMGGQIGVESEKGKGSLFWFTIELPDIDIPQETIKTPVSQTATLSSKKISRILLAEDNPVNQRVITRILKRKKFEVDVAGNGRECIEMLETQSYDLILMDVQMPEMNGIDATRHIRNHENNAIKDIPIIALTAHAMSGDADKFKEVGMNSYVSKPVDIDHLLSEIDNLTRNSG
jgi:PAS domain S-box-containing protein